MRINQHCIPLESPEEWRLALNGIKHTFGHTWENCYAMYLTTGLKTYLYTFEQDNIRIVCPIAEREYGGYVDIVKPYGFSGFVGNGNSDEFPRYWEQLIKEREYVSGYLGLNPIFDYSRHFDSKDIHEYETVYVLDLTTSMDELFENMAKCRRKQLKHWNEIKSDLVLEQSVLRDFFLKNYYDFLNSKNAARFYFFSEETLSFLLNLDNVILVGAQNSGKVVAVYVFAFTGDVCEGLFNVSLPEGRHYTALLTWYAVNYAKSLDIPTFNQGGGGGGMADFKRRFGSEEFPLRCLKQVYRPDIYEVLCRNVNVDPNDMAGYFPAYRRVM